MVSRFLENKEKTKASQETFLRLMPLTDWWNAHSVTSPFHCGRDPGGRQSWEALPKTAYISGPEPGLAAKGSRIWMLERFRAYELLRATGRSSQLGDSGSGGLEGRPGRCTGHWSGRQAGFLQHMGAQPAQGSRKSDQDINLDISEKDKQQRGQSVTVLCRGFRFKVRDCTKLLQTAVKSHC